MHDYLAVISRSRPRPCGCGSGETGHDLFDAQHIYVARVCDSCEPSVRARYTPETFSGYDQGDVDEPIEPD